ncbi:unnamed protein product [Effrenium voratum]|nr:unnamed protein product [Effrenium voratum]
MGTGRASRLRRPLEGHVPQGEADFGQIGCSGSNRSGSNGGLCGFDGSLHASFEAKRLAEGFRGRMQWPGGCSNSQKATARWMALERTEAARDEGRKAQEAATLAEPSGLGREGYLQQRVHRKPGAPRRVVVIPSGWKSAFARCKDRILSWAAVHAVHAAAEEGKLEALKLLLTSGADKEAEDNEGRTPLLRAAATGQTAVVAHLLREGACARHRDKQGSSGLTLAAEHGHVEVVGVLLLNGTVPEDAATEALCVASRLGHLEVVKYLLHLEMKAVPTPPLQAAIAHGHVEVVDALLLARAQLDSEDYETLVEAVSQGHFMVLHRLRETNEVSGSPALHRAAAAGHAQAVRALLVSGASVNAVEPNSGDTALHSAARAGQLEAAQVLQGYSAELNAQNAARETPVLLSVAHEEVLRFLVECRADLTLADENQLTPLLFAARQGYSSACAYLSSRGLGIVSEADLNAAEALEIAAENHFPQVVETLLWAGVDREKAQEKELSTLHLAAASGQVETVQCFLQEGADVNCLSKNGATALYFAAAWAKEDALCVLLEAKAVNLAEKSGWTPLHVAVQRCHQQIIRVLLEAEADPNQADKKQRCPVYFAALMGNLRIVRFLVYNGASADCLDWRGWTPLHVTLAHGHLDTARCLVDAGAALDLTTKTGSTPLAFAALHNNVACLELPLVSMNVPSPGRLLENGAEVNHALGEGYTPLHHAAEFGLLEEGRLQSLHALAEARADLNARKLPRRPAGRTELREATGPSVPLPAGCSPLFAAAALNHLEVVKYLLAAGADKDQRASCKNAGTPLYIASYKGHTAIVKSLLSHSASTDGFGQWTPLLGAVEMAHLDTLQVLLEARAQLDEVEGVSPLRLAVNMDNVQALRLLLQAGDDKEARDSHGWLPVHLAAHRGSLNVLRALLKEKADLESPTLLGATPLHVAALAGQLPVLRALVQARANCQARKQEGWTPLLSAVSQNQLEVVKFLLEAKADTNEAKENGATGVFLAASLNYADVLETLILARAELDQVARKRGGPMHAAASKGHLEAMHYLVAARCNVNLPRHDGATPLFCAVRTGNFPPVHLLLEAAADVDRCQEDGLLPLHAAALHSDIEMARVQTDCKKAKDKGGA